MSSLLATMACGLAGAFAAVAPAAAAPSATVAPLAALAPAPVDVSPVRVAIAFTTPEAGGFAGLYVRGTNGQIYRRDFHLGSSSPRGYWQPLSGIVGSGPAATADGGNTGVEVVAARSTRGTLLIRSVAAGSPLGGWRDLGGGLSSAPAIASTFEPQETSTTMAAVARGNDGSAWLMLRRFGGWTRWLGLGGTFTSAPSVAVIGSELRLFGRGGNGYVYSRRVQLWGTPITPWQLTGPLTTSAVGPPEVPAPTQAYAYRGAGNQLYWYDGTSTNLGGIITSAPDALTCSIIVARGADNALWMNLNGTWRSLGGQIS